MPTYSLMGRGAPEVESERPLRTLSSISNVRFGVGPKQSGPFEPVGIAPSRPPDAKSATIACDRPAWHCGRLDAALACYAEFSEEIDALVRANLAAAEESEALWHRQQDLLAGWSCSSTCTIRPAPPSNCESRARTGCRRSTTRSWPLDLELLRPSARAGWAVVAENARDFDRIVRSWAVAGDHHAGVVFASPCR